MPLPKRILVALATTVLIGCGAPPPHHGVPPGGPAGPGAPATVPIPTRFLVPWRPGGGYGETVEMDVGGVSMRFGVLRPVPCGTGVGSGTGEVQPQPDTGQVMIRVLESGDALGYLWVPRSSIEEPTRFTMSVQRTNTAVRVQIDAVAAVDPDRTVRLAGPVTVDLDIDACSVGIAGRALRLVRFGDTPIADDVGGWVHRTRPMLRVTLIRLSGFALATN